MLGDQLRDQNDASAVQVCVVESFRLQFLHLDRETTGFILIGIFKRASSFRKETKIWTIPFLPPPCYKQVLKMKKKKFADYKERRRVTSLYHGSKISGSRQSFLTSRPFAQCRTMKEKFGLTSCSWVQSCTGKSGNFATMATWRNDFSYSCHSRFAFASVRKTLRGAYFFSLLSGP